MNRFYLAAEFWQSEQLTLSGEEAKHCQQIMRTSVGAMIEIFDGCGESAVCKVAAASKREVVAEIVERKSTPKPATPIVLAQSIPKGKNMDLIIQKAVELGVNEIYPLLTDNTVARADDQRKKQEKWQRVALEACKQCGQNWMPVVTVAQEFSEFIETRKSSDGTLRVAGAILPEMVSLKTALSEVDKAEKVELLVGPEGDFSEQEYEWIVASGFVGANLGELILRSETAAIFMISAAKAQLMG